MRIILNEMHLMQTHVHVRRTMVLAILALVPLSLPTGARAGSGPGPRGSGGGLVESDSVPESPRGLLPVRGVARMTAAGVTEGAWAPEEGGGLQLLVVGVDSYLSGGFSARLELAGKWGHEGAPFPSAQGLSSLDADDFGGLGEAWLEWSHGRGMERSEGWTARLKAGRVDANAEFAYSEAAAPFGNPSFGLSPVLAVLPSYPAPAPSVNAFLRAWSNGPELGAGVYRRGDGSYAVVGQLSGGIAGADSLRWSAGWAEPVGRTDAERGLFVIVERASGDRLSPFLVVSGRTSGPRHLAAGATLPPLRTRIPAFVGAGASLLLDDGTADEAVLEVFAALLPATWLRLQAHGQLHVADGTAPSPGALFRVVVER